LTLRRRPASIRWPWPSWRKFGRAFALAEPSMLDDDDLRRDVLASRKRACAPRHPRESQPRRTAFAEAWGL